MKPSLRIPSLFLRIVFVLLALPLLSAFLLARLSGTAHASALAQAGNPVNNVYLPLINRGGGNGFNPTVASELASGTYTFESLHIPAGVTITLNGPVTITVSGTAIIDGLLIGDCTALELRSQGDLTVLGTIDNRCSDPTTESPAALHLYTYGELQIGDENTSASVETSGDLILSNDPDTPAWSYDLPPNTGVNEPLPPVCSAFADTVWTETAATVNFYAQGLDPDGGPLSFAWNFGDGTTLGAQNPSHDFTTAGSYTVTVTVRDDDSQECWAFLALNIDDGVTQPQLPAVAIEPAEIAAALGESLGFAVLSIDAQDDDLSYLWDFGDGITSTVLTATHSYNANGRWVPTLTVSDNDGNQRTAQAVVYVYQAAIQAAALNAPNLVCPLVPPPGNTILINGRPLNIANPAQAAAGRNGRSRTLSMRGTVIVPAGVAIRSQDGGDGAPVVGRPSARGKHGGRGGSLDLLVNGSITFCAGSLIAAGDGGNGGNATASAPPGARASAIGGNGGAAADHLRIAATTSIVFEGATTIDPGDGGDGGTANATGDAGGDRCTRAQDGAAATAIGGNGGKASKWAQARGIVVGLGNVTVDGGQGGDGGASTATGGAGGNATCPTTASGGTGKDATSRGGEGGEAIFTDRTGAGLTVAPFAFWAGNGGSATATGGTGGAAVAIPAAACSSTTATGGIGGTAESKGGKGGKGRINGDGGTGIADGGIGGAATATGGDCTACQKGGDANATGGKGGNANAKVGKPAPLFDVTTATAGNGGEAIATGGKGGDCTNCPAGKGGPGGVATATGGAGGNASGSGTRDGGDGGTGDATGGKGGKGATCCTPPKPGGDGGDGGNAKSVAGKPGLPNGVDGGNATSGGNGGNGGDGEGPGAGGAGGPGDGVPFDILDGLPGNAGEHCPKPTIVITVTPPHDPTFVSTPTPTATTPTTCTPGGGNCPRTPTPTATATIPTTCTPGGQNCPLTPTPTATATATIPTTCTPGGQNCPLTPTPTPTPTATATIPTTCTPGGQNCPLTPTPTATASATVIQTVVCTPGGNSCPTTATPTVTPTNTPLPTIEIELVELSLTGYPSHTNPVEVQVGQPITLEGRLLNKQGEPQMVDSFFDVFFEIQTQGSTQPPIRQQGEAIPEQKLYRTPYQFANPGFSIVCAVLINPNNGEEQRPPGECLQIFVQPATP